MSRAKVEPILDRDIPAVAEYLHSEMNTRVPCSAWEELLRAPWQSDPPNHGFLLRDGEGRIVGAYLALYSDREIRGERRRICNLAAWCVDETSRFQSIRLLKALLAQDGYDFVDLSPSGNVVPLNRRLGFRELDTQTWVAPNLPAIRRSRSVDISTDPTKIEGALDGPQLQIYRDHSSTLAAHHVLITTPTGTAHVMYRRDRRKQLPIFANIVYASDTDVLRQALPQLRAHLLRRGLPCLLAETRTAGCRPKLSFSLSQPRPKMFKSNELAAEDIDNLYSELVSLVW